MKLLWCLCMVISSSLCAAELSPETKKELISQAVAAQKKAYCPYSQYYVGSALLLKSGKIVAGNNIENASYGLTNCAERTAVFKAVSEGEKDIEAVVVVTRNGGFPCGACRQVLNEFNPKMRVICADENGKILHETTLDMLLPNAFGPQNLD